MHGARGCSTRGAWGRHIPRRCPRPRLPLRLCRGRNSAGRRVAAAARSCSGGRLSSARGPSTRQRGCWCRCCQGVGQRRRAPRRRWGVCACLRRFATVAPRRCGSGTAGGRCRRFAGCGGPAQMRTTRSQRDVLPTPKCRWALLCLPSLRCSCGSWRLRPGTLPAIGASHVDRPRLGQAEGHISPTSRATTLA